MQIRKLELKETGCAEKKKPLDEILCQEYRMCAVLHAAERHIALTMNKYTQRQEVTCFAKGIKKTLDGSCGQRRERIAGGQQRV